MNVAPPAVSIVERKFPWLLFAIVIVWIPLVGFVFQVTDSGSAHPAVNALLNGTSGLFLLAGGWAIRRRHIALHRQCMVSAMVCSALFLVSYLARFATSGTHRYPGEGWDRTLYLAVLLSHSLLAVLALPLILRTFYLGLRRDDLRHRRLARFTWPVWIYISATGVLVYLMLYPIASRLYPG